MIDEQTKMKKNRPNNSQRFPFIPLPKAIEQAHNLYKVAAMHGVPISVAAKAWGYSEKSSSASMTLSALKAFGLIEEIDGNNQTRKIKLTETAVKIIRDPREISPDRDALLKEAALMPAIHKEIVQEYNGLPPSEEVLKTHLLVERFLKDDAAKDFMSEFYATMHYAKVIEYFDTEAEKPSDEMEYIDLDASNTDSHKSEVLQPSFNNISCLEIGTSNFDRQKDLNDIKVLLDGNRLKVSAYVDLKGLKRLKKILESNEILLEDEDDLAGL